MHSRHSIGLHHPLDIIRHGIADIQAPVLTRLIRYLQQVIYLLLINSLDLPRQFRKSLICLVSGLVYNVHVEVLSLMLEQHVRELPERGGCGSENSSAGFVGEGRRRVPRLDLLAKDEADARLGKPLLDERPDGGLDGLEHLGGEWADIVEV